LPELAPNLHAGDSLLFFWSHQPLVHWQTDEWFAEMRRLTRPIQYLRQFENRFVATENPFVGPVAWDRCVNPQLGAPAADPQLPIWVGVDASVKHDSSAVVAVTFDRKAQSVRLIFHRIFQPSPTEPLDFEQTIERTLLDLKKRFQVRKVLFDPYQMQSTSQRLTKAGLRIEEFAQSTPNLTAASQQLYELIQGQGLMVYADPAMRLAITRAIAVESTRGWRIAKEKTSHKIDVIIALAMAAHCCVRDQRIPEEPPIVSPYVDWGRPWNWPGSTTNTGAGDEGIANTPPPKGYDRPSRLEPWFPYVSGLEW
jgi:hypothetical protein